MIHNRKSKDLVLYFIDLSLFSILFPSLKAPITSFRKTIIFLKNKYVYAILLVDLIMEKIHET